MTAETRQSSRLKARDAMSPSTEPVQPQPPQSRKRKPSLASSPAVEEPSTPAKKRNGVLSPSTPIATTAATTTGASNNVDFTDGASKKPRNATVTRLAGTDVSNATLLSPESSRIIASRDVETLSPSKAPRSKSTTANILEEACEYLIRVDERMRPIVENNYCRVFSPEGLAEKVDPFDRLTSGIISQQVSGAAAKSIKAKFVALFQHQDTASTAAAAPTGEEEEEEEEKNAKSEAARFPHPSEVAGCSIERLRTAGLSQRKAEYIKGLAEKFVTGELSAQMLHDAPYDEVLKRLISVRGLGQWSVEMFACFGLKRLDVFSLGDLGVQRGMAAFVGRDVAKLKSKGGKWKYMPEKEMKELSDRFAPYRSLFMWYMWRVEETDVSTME